MSHALLLASSNKLRSLKLVALCGQNQTECARLRPPHCLLDKPGLQTPQPEEGGGGGGWETMAPVQLTVESGPL